MKKLLLSLAALCALAALPGCKTVPQDPNAVVATAETETEYPTGSNIPRKKNKASPNVATMTVGDAEDMRRAADAQRTARH